MKIKYTHFLVILYALTIAQEHYGQGLGEDFDPLAIKQGESKFFVSFEEQLFQEDKFLEELTPQAKETRTSYYRVFFNSNGKVETLGYYSTRKDKELGIKITKISQQVNKDSIPYFTINYTYHPDNENLVASKTLKDKSGRITGTYYYTWFIEKEKLQKIECYGPTDYLYQMELKSYTSYEWSGEKLQALHAFNKQKLPIETYIFKDSFDKESLLSTEIPEYAVGNQNIFIGHLKKYERYEKGSQSKRSYYIEFLEEAGNFLEQKFSGDGILFQEKQHQNIPENK